MEEYADTVGAGTPPANHFNSKQKCLEFFLFCHILPLALSHTTRVPTWDEESPDIAQEAEELTALARRYTQSSEYGKCHRDNTPEQSEKVKSLGMLTLPEEMKQFISVNPLRCKRNGGLTEICFWALRGDHTSLEALREQSPR